MADVAHCEISGSLSGTYWPRIERLVRGLDAGDALHVIFKVEVEPIDERRWRAEALGQHHAIGGLSEARVDLVVDPDVGASEAVNRLLRVAHDEELSGQQSQLAPVALLNLRRIGRQEPCDLDLQRVRVLELVDEQP